MNTSRQRRTRVDTAISPRAPRREREWQFATGDLSGICARLEADASIERLAPVDISDTYFDSPDWMIHRAGYALRLRRAGDTAELTLKSLAAPVKGLSDRREMSEAMRSPKIESALAGPGNVARQVRRVVGRRPLQELFRIQTRRERYALREAPDRDPVAEIALDEVRVAPPGTDASGDERFLRVEVECTAVKPRAIAGWVRDLREATELEPATCSKYGKALAMTGLEPPGAVELGPTVIEASMPAQEAQLAIFRRYFAQVLDREPGTRLGENAEELHEMRVSARRLEAAARLFHAFSPQWAADSLPALALLTRALGKVRDSDVYCEFLDRLAAQLAPELRKVLRPLRVRAEQDRARARRRLLAALDSQRLQKIWSDWTQHLRSQSPPQSRGDGAVIGTVARQLIRRRYRKLRKRADLLSGKSTAEELHAVRRRAKRLRYAVQALGDLYGEPAAKFARAVERLQDVLGVCQDARIRSERTAALAQANAASFPPETLYMMGRLVERDSLAARESRAKLKSAIKKVRGRRWRAMREAMDAVASQPRPVPADAAGQVS